MRDDHRAVRAIEQPSLAHRQAQKPWQARGQATSAAQQLTPKHTIACSTTAEVNAPSAAAILPLFPRRPDGARRRLSVSPKCAVVGVHDTLALRRSQQELKAKRMPEILSDAADIDDLRAVAAGDSHALRRLFQRHARAVYAFALRRLEREADAEDIVSETFCTVWQKAATFGGRSTVRTWLLGIARNKILDTLRARPDFVPESEVEAELAAMPDPADSPLDQLCAEADDARLAQALASLPQTQREALYLFAYEDLSLAEIAQIQGVSVPTVGSRLFLARQTLKRLLGAGAAEQPNRRQAAAS